MIAEQEMMKGGSGGGLRADYRGDPFSSKLDRPKAKAKAKAKPPPENLPQGTPPNHEGHEESAISTLSTGDFTSLDQELNVNIEPLPSLIASTAAAAAAAAVAAGRRRQQPSAPGAYFTDANNTVSIPAQKVPFALVGATVDQEQSHAANLPSAALEQDSLSEEDEKEEEEEEEGTSQSADNLLVANPITDDNPEELQLPKAEEYDPESASNTGRSSNPDNVSRQQEKDRQTMLRAGLLGLMTILLIVGISTTLTITLTNEKEQQSTVQPTKAANSSSGNFSCSVPTRVTNTTILQLLPNHTQWQIQYYPTSPQAMAFEWLLSDPNLQLYYTASHARIEQRMALATLYFATNGGTSWHNNSHWLSYDHHECTWFHKPTFAMKHIFSQFFDGYLDEFEHPATYCSPEPEGLYEHLWLDQNNLQGTLPLELYLLTNLRTVSIGLDNELRGTVSSWIGHLTNLEFIALYRLETPSTIPTQLGLLTKLRGLGLNDNQLYGSIPTELHQLTRLQTFILSRNRQLTGTPLPDTIDHFSNLRWLSIDECKLGGTLPTQMGKLQSLEWMVFGGNQFEGTLPSQLGLLRSLKILSVWGNQLTGSLPSQLGQLKEAHMFSLRDNAFDGTIATQLGQLGANLTVVNLQDNYGLSGTIPTQLGLLTQLEELSFRNNFMTGSLPSQLGLLTNMQRFSVTNNSLMGTIPPELEGMVLGGEPWSLYSLSLTGNPQLSGVIPEALCGVNGTCVESSLNPCQGKMGLNFDCSSQQLCGCNCSCT